MKFVMHRNKTIASTCGLSIEFEKGVMRLVPPAMYAEVIAAGGIPESELADDEIAGTSHTPPPGADRDAKVAAAFQAILTRNVREDFTAGGMPHATIVSKELGWSMNAKERDVAWVKFTANRDADD